MKNILFIFSMVLLLTSCNSAKRNERILDQGNYEQAIDLAIKKLQRDNASGKNDVRVDLLEEAFEKMTAASNRRITFLQGQNTVNGAKETYYTLLNLTDVQDKIRPLLPLYKAGSGRQAVFNMVNYNTRINEAQNAYVTALDREAQIYVDRNTIQDYRTAYNIYCELQELAPYEPGIEQKKDDARFYGTNFILVSLQNRSGQLIPRRLQQELLDFNTYGLDDFWTVYHNARDSRVEYSQGIALLFNQIEVSPERINNTAERRSKRIKDGWEYVLDANGNVAKDSLGNDIKRDKYITVSGRMTFTEQHKAVFVGGDVIYKDLLNDRQVNRFPLSTEFIFENIFATYTGDNRALTNEDKNLLRNRSLPFPSSEQMVYDAGEDIKLRLKDIVANNRF